MSTPILLVTATTVLASSVFAIRYPSQAWTSTKYLVTTVGGLFTVTAVGLWYFQTKLIYPADFPPGSRTNIPNPFDLYGIPYSAPTLRTEDGESISSYILYARRPELIGKFKRDHLIRRAAEGKGQGQVNLEGTSEREKKGIDKGVDRECLPVGEEEIDYVRKRPTVIMFHANAGNFGHRLPLAQAFWEKMGCNVVMLSYRGYGSSTGSPSEKGIRIDAITTLNYVRAHPLLKDTKIIVYGQSIGGCVALDIASHQSDQINAIIIENTPFSLPTLIPLILPFLSPFVSVPNLLTEQWDASISLPKMRKDMPFLGLVGAKDELVKPGQMEAVKRVRTEQGGKLEWKRFEEGTHNDTYIQDGYWAAIRDFIEREIVRASS